ncbi:MAG TPA: ATP phosphoribosyltransferase, partial [Rhabdaerophilum sp.]|nr:ATP phosphoribosyltransferase [Rhabdaerophilum sp.]
MARLVLARIHAEEEAREKRELRAYLGEPLDEAFLASLASDGAEILISEEKRLVLLAGKAQVATLSDRLVAKGATRVLVNAPDYAFGAENPLNDRLAEALATRTPSRLAKSA